METTWQKKPQPTDGWWPAKVIENSSPPLPVGQWSAKIIWNSGPPPAIGWWPASKIGNKDAIRYWDGEDWSVCAYPGFSAESAGKLAKIKDLTQKDIQWSARWWE